jgi:hypothetical protein
MEALIMEFKKRRESDWALYLRIRDECCEARRNYNIRQDLLERDIVKRFVKAIRASDHRVITDNYRSCEG